MKIRNLLIVSFVVVAAFASACGKLDDRMKQQDDINSKSTIDADNQNQDKKAEAMEAELDTKQRFYQAVAGTYEGTIADRSAGLNLKTRFILVPSVPPYRSTRTRTVAEVAADLSTLHFNVQVVQWDPGNGATFGCIFSNIEPNLTTGEIKVIDSNCPNSFSLYVSSKHASLKSWQTVLRASQRNTQQLFATTDSTVNDLAVEMDPTKTQEVYRFSATRQDGR